MSWNLFNYFACLSNLVGPRVILRVFSFLRVSDSAVSVVSYITGRNCLDLKPVAVREWVKSIVVDPLSINKRSVLSNSIPALKAPVNDNCSRISADAMSCTAWRRCRLVICLATEQLQSHLLQCLSQPSQQQKTISEVSVCENDRTPFLVSHRMQDIMECSLDIITSGLSAHWT